MGDAYDALADKLGIPFQLRSAWRSSAGAPPAPAPQPTIPAGPRPGDPGWNITGSQAPELGPPAPPTPSVRPGDPGFSIMKPMPAPAPPPQKPGAPSPPSKPMTPAEREREMIASSRSAEAVGSRAAEEERFRKQGIPMATALPPAMASKFAAASKASDENATKANDEAVRKKNVEGATFADSNGGASGAAAPLVQVSPGGRTPHSWAVQEGIEAPTEATESMRAADEHGRTAAALDYQAGTQQAEYERGYLDRFEQAQRGHAVEERQRADRYQKAYDQSLGRLDDLRAQIRTAQIDPYEGQPGFGQLMGGLAIGLGAAGAALAGGQNAGLEAVKHHIATTIRRQEGALDRMSMGAKAETTFLGALRQKFGDEKEAHNAAWIAYLESAKSELAKIAGSPDVQNPKLLAQYQRAQKAIDEELAGRLKSWHEAASDKVVRHDVNAPPVYAGGGATLSATDEKSNQELTERLVKGQIPGMRNDADRLLATIPKEGDVPGLGGIHGAANQLGGTAEKVDNAIYSWVGSKQGQEVRQAAAVLFNRQLKDESGAAVSDQELERQKAAFYGARDARSARAAVTNYVNRLNALESTVRSGFKDNVNAVQRQREADERKKLAPTKKFSGPEDAK